MSTNKLSQFIESAKSFKDLSDDSPADSPEFKAWKVDVLRFLRKQYGETSTEVKSFEQLRFYASFSGVPPSEEQKIFQKGLETAILYLKNYQSDFENETDEKQTKQETSIDTKKIFIVHGRDEGVKAQISSLLLKMNLEPIILHQKANEGQTLIEKLEKYADVKAAIILFTGDDVGKYKDDSDYEKRARQNVIFEAGYFMGKLGRANTIILAENGLNIQSDLQGYIYIPLDEHQRWHFDVARELKAIGFNIDMNKLV